MKMKVTEKSIKLQYKTIIKVGYCEAYYLLYDISPRFYTSGIYGWNADIYPINYDIAIVTGYRPFGNVEDYNLLKKYNDKARKIVNNHTLTYKEQVAKIEKLRNKYLEELLNRKGE